MAGSLGVAPEQLFDRYNRCLDIATSTPCAACTSMTTTGFVHFDNHADSDSVGRDDHLFKVSAFAGEEIVPLQTEILAASVHGEAGYLVAQVRYRRAQKQTRLRHSGAGTMVTGQALSLTFVSPRRSPSRRQRFLR